MVPRFLLYDPSDMSIEGIRGKGKFSIWGGLCSAATKRCFAFWNVSCAKVVHSNVLAPGS